MTQSAKPEQEPIGCGDIGCVFGHGKQRGMSTNGGCCCNERQLRRGVMRLRAELASVQALTAAERAVVDAATEWRGKAVPSSARYDNAWWRLYDAAEALLALRKEQDNGNG